MALETPRDDGHERHDAGPLHVLLLDNYDSYTYNLFQQLARIGGREPWVVRNDELTAAMLEALDPDAIVISPGPGHPDRTRDFGSCGLALERATPLLGVCLGHQGLAVRYGGRVEPATPPFHGRLSPIHHQGTELFEGIAQGFAAVRYHSLVVSPLLPACLEATAFTDEGLIMAVRHRERPQWGVQFHPESICTEHGDRIIANFLGLARRAAPRARARVKPERRPSSAAAPVAPPSLAEAPAVPTRARLHHRQLAHWTAPEDAFVGLYADATHAFWLDSARTDDAGARYSFMGAPTQPSDRIVRYRAPERELAITQGEQRFVHHQSLFEWLERELQPAAHEGPELPFPYRGGPVGYFGYGLKGECGGSFPAPTSWPDAALLCCSRYLAFDHEARAVHAVAQDDDPARAEAWLDAVAAALAELRPAPPVRREQLAGPLEFRLVRAREGYLDDIDRCLREIGRGETYEVCLTNQLIGPPLAHPLDAYRELRARNPAPYGAYLRLGEHAVLSCSPELFLRIDPAGHVVSKPIKGTRRRGATAPEDRRLREELARSEKDRAENLMIVDLLRNDLGRVCEIGSVEAPALMRVESFATVHQLVSTVTGRLRPDHSAVACLRAAFPGGSMTGAPKLRTMEIIDALEPRPRGVYSGSIGYLSADGAAELAITIRTAVTSPEETSIGVGGAIVALSDPEAELEELLLKGEALMSALALAQTGRADAWKISSGSP